MKKATAALAAILFAWTVPAGADASSAYELFGRELNPYIGGAFGRATAAEECGGGPADLPRQTLSDSASASVTVAIAFSAKCAGNGTAYKFYAGIRLHEYLALEGGYASLGEHERTVSARAREVGGARRLNGAVKVVAAHDGAWTGSAVAMLPLMFVEPHNFLPSGELIALGRVGMHMWEFTAATPESVRYTLQEDPPPEDPATYDGMFSHPRGDSGTDLFFGGGAEYLLDNGVGLRLEWERYLFGGEWQEADIDLISLGAVYRF